MDLETFVGRYDISRKLKAERDLIAAKKDPIYEEVRKMNEELSKGLSPTFEKKQRKIPGITDTPFVLPEVSVDLKQRLDEEFDASIKQYDVFLRAKESGQKMKMDVKMKPT
jgi:hypothetical protein